MVTKPRCQWHDTPISDRKTFGGTKFVVISTIFGPSGMIVRCTCDEATKQWRAANKPDQERR